MKQVNMYNIKTNKIAHAEILEDFLRNLDCLYKEKHQHLFDLHNSICPFCKTNKESTHAYIKDERTSSIIHILECPCQWSFGTHPDIFTANNQEEFDEMCKSVKIGAIINKSGQFIITSITPEESNKNIGGVSIGAF